MLLGTRLPVNMERRRKFITTMIAMICFLVISTFILANNSQVNSINQMRQFSDMSVLDVRGRFKNFSLSNIGQQMGLFEEEKKPLRIICLLTTCPKYHYTRAKSVVETWGKRCDHIFFVTTKDNQTYPHLNLVYADLEESYDKSWGKMRVLFKFAYENYFDKVDWIVKMDDDSYMIAENMRTFLADKDTNDPVFFGRNFKVIVNQGYVSGGAGYVMSKKALKLLVEEALPNGTFCEQGENGYEDIHVAKCLEGVGVRLGNSIDTTGEKFHPLDPVGSQNIPEDMWMQTYSKYKPRKGIDCCSTLTISFHYVSPEMMYTMEMLLYKIKVIDMTKITRPDGQLSELLLDAPLEEHIAMANGTTLREMIKTRNKLLR